MSLNASVLFLTNSDFSTYYLLHTVYQVIGGKNHCNQFFYHCNRFSFSVRMRREVEYGGDPGFTIRTQ